MFSQTRSSSAIVTKRYIDSEKQALTEQFKVNIFVFEAITGAGRERDRENKYIFFYCSVVRIAIYVFETIAVPEARQYPG